MNVAISGDRSTALTDELSPGTFLFALARGFGGVRGTPIAQLALARLRADVVRRTRGRGLMRALRRPKGIAALLSASLKHVSAEIFSQTASNDDYVDAGCSLTMALLIGDSLHVAHAGGTAAYLLRDGNVVRLTKTDAIQTSAGMLLTRALGTEPDLRVSVGTIALSDGDGIVFAARRYSPEEEQRRHWESEQALIVRFAASPPLAMPHEGSPVRRTVTAVLTTVLFYAMLCLR